MYFVLCLIMYSVSYLQYLVLYMYCILHLVKARRDSGFYLVKGGMCILFCGVACDAPSYLYV